MVAAQVGDTFPLVGECGTQTDKVAREMLCQHMPILCCHALLPDACDLHATRCFGKSYQDDLLNKVHQPFGRQAGFRVK
jgi:hypothetical protein